MEYEDLLLLKNSLELLADERDVRTGVKVDDTILKNKFNKQVLTDAAFLVDKLLKLDFDPTSIDRRKKYAFYLSEKDKSEISISKQPVPISVFTYSINDHVDNTKMKRIKASEITNWLLQNGYLSEIESDDGRKFKILTDKSTSIGITSEKRTSPSKRVYEVNLYDENAQRFIIDHMQDIVNNQIRII